MSCVKSNFVLSQIICIFACKWLSNLIICKQKNTKYTRQVYLIHKRLLLINRRIILMSESAQKQYCGGSIVVRIRDRPKNRVSPYVHKQYLRRAAIEVGSTFRLIKRFLNDGGSLINPKPSEFQSFVLL